MDEREIQWENSNALRKYPLVDFATCVDDDGRGLDPGIVVGLSIVSFRPLANPRLAGLYVGPELVSAVFADDEGPLGQAVSGLESAHGMVQIEPMDPRVSGFVRFGDSYGTGSRSHRFSTYGQSGILPFCAIHFPDGGVNGFVDGKTGSVFAGEVSFDFGNGVDVAVGTEGTSSTVTLSLSDAVARSISNGCAPTDLATSCIAPVIRTINGVEPDEDGSIAIVLQ